MLVVLAALLAGCSPQAAPATLPPSETTTPALAPATATASPGVRALWISPAVPDPLRVAAEAWGLPLTQQADGASVVLDEAQSAASGGAEWTYALVAPFPTV